MIKSKLQKHKLFCLAVIIICVVIIAVLLFSPKPDVTVSAATDVVSWGLKYKPPGTPEVDKQGRELLQKYRGAFVGDTSRQVVYFTFDLGYEAGYTGKVLDILKQHQAKAVFFLCGNYLKEETLINRMLQEGHTIGNHTNHHRDLPAVSVEKASEDIRSLQQMCKEKYGITPTLFRPPAGRFNERVMQLAQAEGLHTVMWSMAYADWSKEAINADNAVSKMTSRVHPGAIILLHITSPSAPAILSRLMDRFSEMGYSFGTPEELMSLIAS